MDFPGQYPQPLVRASEARVPVISSNGSITGRWRAVGSVSGTGRPSSDRSEHATLVTIQHLSGSYCGIQFQQTHDADGGTRTNLGSPFGLNVGGVVSQLVYPSGRFVELVGISGAGNVRVVFNSQIEFETLAFSKTDPGVPVALWKAQNVAAESSLPH